MTNLAKFKVSLLTKCSKADSLTGRIKKRLRHKNYYVIETTAKYCVLLCDMHT